MRNIILSVWVSGFVFSTLFGGPAMADSASCYYVENGDGGYVWFCPPGDPTAPQPQDPSGPPPASPDPKPEKPFEAQIP